MRTEHLLLAIVEASPDIFQHVCEASVFESIITRLAPPQRSGDDAPAGKLPVTTRAQRALHFAMGEAQLDEIQKFHGVEQPNFEVELTHLVLGLLREEKGVAAATLRELGVADHREWGLRIRRGEPFRGEYQIRIDDSSDRTFYEQIIDQVREAVAAGRLAPGDRLPSVRHLADLLELAPGTVARAYRALEE